MKNHGETILVTTTTAAWRGGRRQELKFDVLAENVNLFLTQMQGMLEKAPDSVGKFHFSEFEAHADISAKGQLVLLGAGGEAGATGGVIFKFKRRRSTDDS